MIETSPATIAATRTSGTTEKATSYMAGTTGFGISEAKSSISAG